MGLWLAAHPWVVVAVFVAACAVCGLFGGLVNGERCYRAGWAQANEEHDRAAAELAAARGRRVKTPGPGSLSAPDDAGHGQAQVPGPGPIMMPRLGTYIRPEPPTVVHPTAVLSPLPHPDSAAAERKAGPDTLARGFLAVRNERFAAAVPEGWRR